MKTLIAYLRWATERFGLAFALRTGALWALGITSIIHAPIGHGHRLRVALRPGTADLFVYDEIYRDHAYDLPLPDAPAYIVDAGGHIGLASVWLAQRYPQSRILCVEPEPANVAIAQRNVRAFPNVTVVHAALWSHTSRVAIQNPSAATWSFRVEPSSMGVQAYSVKDLLWTYQFPRVDFLKIDIEGSEVEVLGTARDWIGSVSTMMVELHDRFRPGCQAALEAAIAQTGLAVIEQRTNVSLLANPAREMAV